MLPVISILSPMYFCCLDQVEKEGFIFFIFISALTGRATSLAPARCFFRLQLSTRERLVKQVKPKGKTIQLMLAGQLVPNVLLLPLSPDPAFLLPSGHLSLCPPLPAGGCLSLSPAPPGDLSLELSSQTEPGETQFCYS